MAIREQALGCPAFCRLKTAYDHRKAVLTSWRDAGKKIVCVAGYDVPEEIILAAGMQPMRITGYYDGARTSAEKYLEYSFGAIWKGIWETLTEDYAGLMDHLVFCSSSDMFLKLFYYYRTLARLEPERPMPRLTFLDYELVERSFKSQERNERELRDLVETVETWSGSKVTDAALKDAIRLCNAYRAALTAFNALRQSTVTGSEALVVIGGSMYLPKAEAIAAVKEVTEAAKSWPATGLAPVYYVGSPQETTEVYELAEAAGINFVGEDHDMGQRMFDYPVREDIAPISALADRLLQRMPSSEKGSIKNRVTAIGEKLDATGARGFLTFMNVNDEAYVWDYPSVKKQVLEPRGIPSVTVQKQTWPLSDPAGLTAQFAALAKEVQHG